MMNVALYRAMWRLHGKTLGAMAIGSFLYVLMIVTIYPTLAPEDMNELLKKMPEEMMKVFGIEAGVQRLNDFIAVEYHNFMYLILLMVYSVVIPTRLVARHVDRGSMAFLLSTPLSRPRLVLTQVAFFITGLGLINLFTVLGGIAGDVWILDQPALDRSNYVELNLVCFLFFSVIGAYSFLFSCLFDDEKKVVSWSATVTILFYAMDFAGKLSEKLDWLRNWTLFSLYEPARLARGEEDILWTAVGLGFTAMVLFLLAAMVFRRRNLSL
jgi:ABC-2 type transport system permease protein